MTTGIFYRDEVVW